MANNIQIIGNITDTNTISRYSSDDVRLIGSQEIQNYFDPNSDYVEYYVYDIGGTLLGIDYSYNKFKLPTDSALTPSYAPLPNSQNQITDANVGVLNSTPPDTGSSYAAVEIDPVNDLQQLGYSSGEFKVQYNFFKNKVGSPNNEYFLKRISSDRTEISITSTALTNAQIEQDANNLINELNASLYFVNYLVNLGLNQQYVTVNVALDKIESGYEILFKLYEPLSDSISEKTTLWVVEEKVNPYSFNINLDTLITPPAPLMLRGANFTIPISREVNTISTQYGTYSDIVTSLQTSQNTTYQKLLNTLTSSSIAINVDYTDYNNFVFFGSVEQRIDNFYSKIKEIEDYNSLITSYTPSASFNPNLQLEINRYTASINNIISNFDGYETYLYFESSSYTWPKSTSTLPYILYSTGSVSGSTWFIDNKDLASTYDELNQNNLQNGIPTFLIDNPDNSQYLLFLNMIGQYFDNIWIMLKSVTDINLANNNLNEGISKDLVYHVLKSFGIDLYNSSEGDSLNQYLVGNNTGSAYFSGSLTDFSPTSSYLNNIPKGDLVAEVYKRIYHNLPLLVKTKGTTSGLQNIVTMFGVTSSILSVKEYGGESKAEYLKGYSTNKVRLGSINPLENVLSPITSIQQITTASVDYLDNDLQYVDVSFSPQNQIDLYISQSISSSNSTFDLDEYIGDPRQQYSITYPDLDNQRKIYFEQGTGSYSGFTSSYLDYNGFIRLIQFFDNSLFKTLEAFVPARTSLSTGITFNSPVLERNKFAYANPTNSTTESIKEGEIISGSIGSEYGYLYDNLSGDKSPYYSGEISGSEINAYDTYFIPSNENPYLGDINVWNSQHDADEQISLSQFALSDYNVLFNNISSSRLSANRKILEKVQDSYKTVPISAVKAEITITITQPLSGDWWFDPYSQQMGATMGATNLSANFTVSTTPYSFADDFYFTEIKPVLIASNWDTYFDIDESGVTQGEIVFRMVAKTEGTSSTLTNISVGSGGSIGSQIFASNNIAGVNAAPSITIPPVYISSSAELQDSYLSLISYKDPRYDGVKIKSATYNQYTAGDSGSYGKTSAIDKYQAYFLTFSEIRNAYPELLNKSTLWINSLVDKDGRQLAVSNDTSSNYYNNLIDNFGKDSIVNLQITTLPTGSFQTDLDQSTTVYRPALLWPKVILTNESGSTQTSNGNVSWITASLAFYESQTTGSNINKRTYTRLQASWSFGASSRNILTASNDLAILIVSSMFPSNIANPLPNNYAWAQDITTASFAGTGGANTYDTPIPVTIKSGQEIRFLQNEDYVYTIKSTQLSIADSESGTVGTVKLTLDRDISTRLTATTINNGYLIRENQIDPTKLVINAPKLIGGAPGYLTPQYMTPELATNLNGVVETLKENGIL